MLKTLLQLQKLDLQIEACRGREQEIPHQKNKFKLLRERLENEIKEREAVCQRYILEQRESESEIEQKQDQMGKYEQQLNIIKKKRS